MTSESQSTIEETIDGIIKDFNSAVDEPAESFRVEKAVLYFEVINGMKMLDEKMIEKAETCK